MSRLLKDPHVERAVQAALTTLTKIAVVLAVILFLAILASVIHAWAILLMNGGA